jgi:ribosomal protein L23
MYSKHQAAQLKQEFWTAFGQYMSPVFSAEGEKVNWVNYKTGEKHIRFRMTADNKVAAVAIEIDHKDKDIQQLYYEQFLELKQFLVAAAGEEWKWQLHGSDDWGKTISRIYTELTGVSVLKKEDWPHLISFFKQRMIALDNFWSNVRYSFENLR